MRMLALLAPFFFATNVEAAVSKDAVALKPANNKAVLVKATQEALGLPFAGRLEALERQGPQGYRNLVTLMFDEKMTMSTRWRAVTAVGRIGGKESLPELERALKRPEWFMRNAGLVAVSSIDRALAIRWSRKLIDDRALVVRAAAVETLADLRSTDSAGLLWEKLYAKENFRHSQSLFVRRRIVEALAMFKPVGTEGKFIKVLTDADESLHPLAIHALEQLTHNALGASKDPLAFKRELWQKWWQGKAQAKL